MDYIIARSSHIEFRDNEQILKDYFGDTSIEVQDILDAFVQVLEENEELQIRMQEDYEQKHIDPYEEYGISESDFH